MRNFLPACISLIVIVLEASASAAPITWDPVSDTSEPTVVVTTGTLVEAINGTGAAGVATVNGVDFFPSDTLLSSPAASVGLSGGTTLDPGLDALLNTVEYGGGTSTTITVGGGSLVVGQSYLIQIFFTDLRRNRVMTYGDNEGNAIDVASIGAPGTFGRNATGIFTADSTTQIISLTTNGFGNAHINGYQIRSSTAVPSVDTFTASSPLIASGESTTIEWQITGAASAEIDNGIGSVDTTSGSLLVSPPTTTTYILTAANGGGSVTSEVTVGVDVAVLAPVLNEFLASNDSDFADEDGNFSDWIEIYNPNAFAIDLDGYHLTSDSTNLTEWTFPTGVSLNGNSYLIVFATGISRGLPELHTNFKISAGGGVLALVSPDGSTVINQFIYPPQQTDISYGSAGYLSPPTPAEENGAATSGFVADTSFDVDRGFYDAPFTVNITTATLGATVVYTTDGSDPTLTNGAASADSASVPINSTTVLRAAAFKTGLTATNIDTQTYLFTADIIEQSNMDPDVVDDPAYSGEIASALKSIRTLSLVTDPDNLYDNSIGILQNKQGRGLAWERPVSIEFIDFENPTESYQANAGLRMHGNGSRGSPKNSLRLLFRADYGPKKLNYSLFGEDFVTKKFNTIVLRAQNANSWTSTRSKDRQSTTFLQDSFAKDTQGAMGHPTAGSTFVHLFLNGTYWGLYNPTERPDGSFGEDHFGGDDTDYDAVSRRFSVEVQSGTKTHWDAMIAHSNTELDTQAEYDTLKQQYMDVDNLIDYMLMHQFMQARDGPDDFGHNNMRLVRRNNPGGLWQAYAWDMEYSMIDTTGTRDYSYPFPIYSSSRNNNNDITDSIASIYIRLKDNNPEFQLRYADRAYKHLYNGGALTSENATARFETRALEIESSVIGESARWGDQRRAAPYTRDGEWATERNRINNEFFPARPDHVISQLRTHGLYPSIDPPILSQHGGAVATGFSFSMASDSGVIYFTTDGSDPREAWTGTAVGAAYSTPVALFLSTTVKARTLVAGEWSALTEASFLVGTLADSTNLVISEIFYQPPGASEELEFIELQNISSETIELGRVQFTGGIELTFAPNTRLTPGIRVLLVRNLTAFNAEYGNGMPIVGEFQNSTGLSNSGERITLLAANGSAIRDFAYSDKLPWPTSADGQGHSLVLTNPASNPNHANPKSWRASTNSGGNPSTTDSIPYQGDDPLIYALGADSPHIGVEIDGQTLSLSYVHLLAADEIDLHLEWSTDLNTWAPLDETFGISGFTLLEGDHERVSFTSTVTPMTSEPQFFIRLIAE
ncbi:CotH kinase family protein [bacterium]|nr:CotH kinase family protein [bacterium]